MHADADESVGRDIHRRGDEIKERENIDEAEPEPGPEDPTCDQEDWADNNGSLPRAYDVGILPISMGSLFGDRSTDRQRCAH